MTDTANKQSNFFKKVYAQVKKIPAGKVASYGDIAKQIGFKRYARHVGYALNGVKKEEKVPWHRVVNGKGEVSARKEGHADILQRQLLEQEGIVFNTAGKINMKRYRWEP